MGNSAGTNFACCSGRTRNTPKPEGDTVNLQLSRASLDTISEVDPNVEEEDGLVIPPEEEPPLQPLENGTQPPKDGVYLEKLSPSLGGGWQKRWFMIEGNFLCWYSSRFAYQRPNGVLGKLSLRQAIRITTSKAQSDRCFEIEVPYQKIGKHEKAKVRVFKLRAGTKEEAAVWMKRLQEARERAIYMSGMLRSQQQGQGEEDEDAIVGQEQGDVFDKAASQADISY